MVDAILYVVRTGCAWRQLPGDVPPWQTVYWYFNQWEQVRVTEKVLPVVREQLRVAEGRNLEPGAGLIDSQSVKGADTVGRGTRGYDAGKPVRYLFADGGFAGRLLDWAATILSTTLQIVRKPAGQQGFAVTPRRWAAERTFAWLTAHRRLARDYERDPRTSEAMIRWAAINTITRRIAREGPATRQQRRQLTPTT